MADHEPLGFRPVRMIVWTALSLAFVVSLYASARMGIRHAEAKVPPESVALGAMHKMGEDIEAEGTFVFAQTQHELREYYFREGTTAGTGISEKKDADVFEYKGLLVVHTVRADLTLLQVEIVTGPRVGERFWIRAELLPVKE